ncbi:S8 family peptidase [Acanthopleuribacter pedis]|uniref:S8 family serine peptidase n=1 Tax=Acanthopleuribacter pedis TaxID=442870 RepID=A0A8J7U8A2_9BACT|nr:S8 family serine peptidase [Acanthopleuribacter pedis]MBO1322311.1 S8 family serine peptidase [Acanthopleuribacter pedis]
MSHQVSRHFRLNQTNNGDSSFESHSVSTANVSCSTDVAPFTQPGVQRALGLTLAFLCLWFGSVTLNAGECGEYSCDEDNKSIIQFTFVPDDLEFAYKALSEAIVRALEMQDITRPAALPGNLDYVFPASFLDAGDPEIVELGAYISFTLHRIDGVDIDRLLIDLGAMGWVVEAYRDPIVQLDRAAPAAAMTRNKASFWEFDAMAMHSEYYHPATIPGYTPRVAVIDSGLDTNHPEFATSSLVAARNWTKEGSANDVTDRLGHGTHVSGIIAANAGGSDRPGILSWGELMPLKVFDASGKTCLSNIAAAIGHAVANRADVVSMSFSLGDDVGLLRDTIKAVSPYTVLVGSAGNKGQRITDAPAYPGAYSDVIGVSASGCDGATAWFSNTGYEITLPGKAIDSTVPGGERSRWSGTSMAAPFASGTAGMLKAFFPHLSARELHQIIVLAGGNAERAWNFAKYGLPKRKASTRTTASKPSSGKGAQVFDILINGRPLEQNGEYVTLKEGFHYVEVIFAQKMDTEVMPQVATSLLGTDEKRPIWGEWQSPYVWAAKWYVGYWVDWGQQTFWVTGGRDTAGFDQDEYCGEGAETRPDSPSSHAMTTEDETSLDSAFLEDRDCDSAAGTYVGSDPSRAWRGIIGYRVYVSKYKAGPYVRYSDQVYFDRTLPRVEYPYYQIKFVHRTLGEIEPVPHFFER